MSLQPTEFLSVYITAPTRDEAEKIAETLVREELAACANVFPGISSTFRWQGKVERAEECAIIAKIVASDFGALQKRIEEIHPYECPCIAASPIVAGNESYLKWLKGE